MTVQTTSSGLLYVQEQILLKNTYSMSVPANNAGFTNSIPHPLKISPFCDYMISIDGGTTFVPPTFYFSHNVMSVNISMYADDTTIYFQFNNTGSSPASNPAFTLVYDYRLYIVEAVTR